MIQLSPDQEAAKAAIIDWYRRGEHQLKTLGGYAGTGKSTVLDAIKRELPGVSILFVSLTGKAVNVMRSKISSGNFSTIHSLLYRPVIENDRIVDWHRKFNDQGLDEDGFPVSYDLIVNDEASMTSEDLYKDLAGLNVPILAVGDHGQLPPITGNFNLMGSPDIRLEQIHRQAEGNPIVQLATKARLGVILKRREYSDTVAVYNKTAIPKHVSDLMLTDLADSMIIVDTNNKRVNTNNWIRAKLGFSGDPTVGDRIICLANSARQGLYNGQRGTIERVIQTYSDIYIFSVAFDDDPTRPIEVQARKDTFGVPKPEFTRARGLPFDFGYAITCHKAQGSEARRVFVAGSGFGDAQMRSRWLYTAVTRASSELYVFQ